MGSIHKKSSRKGITTVLIITSKGCQDCRRAKEMIVSAATLADKKVEFNELDLGSNEALEKAMLYGMTTVPSFVIRGKVFNTATPPLNEIVAAFQSNVV